MKLAVQVPARERVGRDCVSRREGVAGSFSERLPPCLELPSALAEMQGLMAVVGGHGERCIQLLLWVAQRGLLAWGVLRCVFLSAIWPFQGDVLIFSQPSVTAASSRAIPGRSLSGGRLSLPSHGSCTPLPQTRLAEGSPGASPG